MEAETKKVGHLPGKEKTMNMFEEARAVYGILRISGTTQEEAAKKLGVSQSYIANKLRLLKFSQPMKMISPCTILYSDSAIRIVKNIG